MPLTHLLTLVWPFGAASALWLAVLIPASLVASLVHQRRPGSGGWATTTATLILATPLALVLGRVHLAFHSVDLALAALGFLVSLALNLIVKRLGAPEIAAEALPASLGGKVLLLLLLAPLSEETLYRGLVVGFLLAHRVSP